MRKINKIIIHCTATPASQVVLLEDIRRWHLARGFSDIGYHFIVHQDGLVNYGRPLLRVGAHCKGLNKHSIGICYVGGLDENGKPADTRTPSQKSSLVDLVSYLLDLFPCATIHGHNEFANKACPCFDIDELRKEVFKNGKKD